MDGSNAEKLSDSLSLHPVKLGTEHLLHGYFHIAWIVLALCVILFILAYVFEVYLDIDISTPMVIVSVLGLLITVTLMFMKYDVGQYQSKVHTVHYINKTSNDYNEIITTKGKTLLLDKKFKIPEALHHNVKFKVVTHLDYIDMSDQRVRRSTEFETNEIEIEIED